MAGDRLAVCRRLEMRSLGSAGMIAIEQYGNGNGYGHRRGVKNLKKKA
jgi:hypothetical protein